MRVEGTLVPDVSSMSLEETVGHLMGARYEDWPLIEKMLKQGVIGEPRAKIIQVETTSDTLTVFHACPK